MVVMVMVMVLTRGAKVVLEYKIRNKKNETMKKDLPKRRVMVVECRESRTTIACLILFINKLESHMMILGT
jgi:hypothetical protein